MSLDSSVQNRFSLKVLSVAALSGLTVFGVGANSTVQAEDTTTITTTLSGGTEHSLEIQTTYGDGNSSVTQDVTILGQTIPYTYKFDNLYGDVVNGDASVDTSVTVLGQPVTFTYKYDSSVPTNGNMQNNSDISSTPIVGNFINIENNSAIHNQSGKIGDIESDFIGNVSSSSYGGAIYNQTTSYSLDEPKAEIGNIKSNFIGNTALFGGAIANFGDIESITGDFIGNIGKSYGGAIYNSLKIGNINGDFIGNRAETGSAGGGAIANYSIIGNITGDFINNYAYYDGGAIFINNGRCEDIKGNFIGNVAADFYSEGGGIYNDSYIKSITGDFINNYAYRGGGAIYNVNNGTIPSISGRFVGNSIFTGGGGAIYNYGVINELKGEFIGNYIKGEYPVGGAINTTKTMGNITADFIGNYADSTGYWSYAYGGAIYNQSQSASSTVGDITGDFIGNYVIAGNGEALGGAIFNRATLGSKNAEGDVIGGIINSSFIGNYAITEHSSSSARGGAIYTTENLNLISTDGYKSLFIDNYVQDVSNGRRPEAIALSIPHDGIYMGSHKISSINRYKSIYKIESTPVTLTIHNDKNAKTVMDGQIVGMTRTIIPGMYYDSSNNRQYVDSNYNDIPTPEAVALTTRLNLTGDGTGSVSLYDDILNIDVSVSDVTVDFANAKIHNYVLNSLTSQDTASYNIDVDLKNGTADTIETSNASTGTVKLKLFNLLNNSVGNPIEIQILKTQNSYLQLALSDNIVEIPYVENVVYNDQIIAKSGAIELFTTDTTNDSIRLDGSKIYDGLQVLNIKESDKARDFIFRTTDNYNVSDDLGETTSGILNVVGLSEKSQSTINAQGHSLFELSNETELNISNVEINGAEAIQGSVINATNADSTVNLRNVSLKDNVSIGEHGGAIYSVTDVEIITDGVETVISGNSANGVDEAIYMADADNTLVINTKNSGVITIDDSINGKNGYDVVIAGDGSGNVELNSSIKNANVTLDKTILSLSNSDTFSTSDLIINSGTLDLINDKAQQQNMHSLSVNGNFNLNLDADLENVTMDRLPENTIINNGAFINVDRINLLSDAVEYLTKIPFAYEGFKDNVKYIGANELSQSTQITTAFAPIYKYSVAYDNTTGTFIFNKGAGSVLSNNNAFNPAVLGSSTGAAVGATGTMNQTMNYAFQNSDNFMNIPYLERISYRDRNKYALSPTGDATDVGTYSPLFTKNEYGSAWFKPYATFENVGLKNGPKVSNITYGTLVGFDTDLESIKGGWNRTITGYIGYNGASQRYSGVDTYQNGGLIGGTVTLYKGNFFNATTLSVGASVANNSTMYGNDDYAMLLSGIGNKTGYNFEFKEGKVILQPSMLLSYTFVNTFDYTNAAGVRIDNDPLHAIQLAPGMKLIGNTKDGWQPYLSVSMVWNLMGKSDATANGVRLPQMSIKPYVQYGVGVQKRFKDHFMGFGQAMIQNGGRNGISLTAGFRWAIGKDKDQKVETNKQNGEIAKQVRNNKVSSVSDKKILKQMTPEQKVALGGKNHSTRTVTSGMLKQL